MKAFCYACCAVCIGCGYLFARAGFYPLALQASGIGIAAALATALLWRRS